MCCKVGMLATVLIILCGCTLQIAARSRPYCPMWACSDAVYKSTDLTTCLDGVEQTGTCIQNTMKQSYFCQSCDEWDFSRYTSPEYLAGLRISICYHRECKFSELSHCMMKLTKILSVLDTSKVDDIISCIGKWNPDLDVRTCMNNSRYAVGIPEFVDHIELTKQILREIKGGCDPVMPLLQCRQHLQPLSKMVLGYEIGSSSEEAKTKAIQDGVDCMERAMKKYPCKTLQSLLPSIRDAAIKWVITTAQNPQDADDAYKIYCDNLPKYPQFFRK